MGQFNKSNYKNYANPILWSQGFKIGAIDTTYAKGKLPANLLIKKGTFCSLLNDGSGNDYVVLYKSGKVYEAVTADTTVKLYKEHSFGIGDIIYDGSTAVTINDIDTNSYDDYDLLTVSANVTFLINEIIYNLEDPTFASENNQIHVILEDVVFNSGETVNVVLASFAVLDVYKLPNYWDAITNAFLNTLSHISVIPQEYNSVNGKGYKEYIAILNQSGGGAPVATVLKDEIGNITYNRASTGSYSIISGDSAFAENKTYVLHNLSCSTASVVVTIKRHTTSYFLMKTYDASTGVDALVDNQLDEMTLVIRIYD